MRMDVGVMPGAEEVSAELEPEPEGLLLVVPLELELQAAITIRSERLMAADEDGCGRDARRGGGKRGTRARARGLAARCSTRARAAGCDHHQIGAADGCR